MTHDGVRIAERHRLSANHWYRFLPTRVQYWIAHIGVKLGIIRRYGRLCVTVYDSTGKIKGRRFGYNIISNVGIQRWGDILAKIEVTNTSIEFMEPGSSATAPTINDTDIGSGLTPHDRIPVTQITRSSVSPFEVIAETFINSTKYDRPQTIRELAVFFAPDETGVMFARGVLSSPITLGVNDTATLTYGLVFR